MTSHQLRINVTSAYLIAFIPIFFGWSFLLLTFYTGGDQVVYLNFFNALKGASINEIMGLAYVYITSVEPLSVLILWLGANLGIDKNIYISLLNLIFALGVFRLLQRHQSPWYIYILVFSNFYFIVLMTGAERLKIAYILLVYAALMPKKLSYTLALASPLAHLQSIILLLSIGLAKISAPLKILLVYFRIKINHLKIVIPILIVFLVIILILQNALLSKANAYFEKSDGITEIINILLLIIIAWIITKDRFQLMIALLPLVVVVYMLGGMRVNMIAFFVFFYLILKERCLTHPLSLLLLIYFSLKSVPFIKNIFIYGNGFAN